MASVKARYQIAYAEKRRDEKRKRKGAKAQRRKGAKTQRRKEISLAENELSRIVIDAAIEVHRTLGGPGLLESVYEEALAYELQQRGIDVERQRIVPLSYKGKRLTTDLRIDLLVGGKVIVECKATRDDHPVSRAQALTYLRLLDLRLALVINFGKPTIKDGVHRVVNSL